MSARRQAGAEYLLLDSGAQLHACPIKCPGQKAPLPDPGIRTASGARLQHDGGRLVTDKLPEGRTLRELFHACASRAAVVLEHPDETQPNTVAQGMEFVLCQRDVGRCE